MYIENTRIWFAMLQEYQAVYHRVDLLRKIIQDLATEVCSGLSPSLSLSACACVGRGGLSGWVGVCMCACNAFIYGTRLMHAWAFPTTCMLPPYSLVWKSASNLRNNANHRSGEASTGHPLCLQCDDVGWHNRRYNAVN
jgi:hypothetical protein